MSKANAAVLPVPVWAVPIKSFPARTIGNARSWIAVGSTNPIACVPRTTSGKNPKRLNDTARETLKELQSYTVKAEDTTLSVLADEPAHFQPKSSSFAAHSRADLLPGQNSDG